MHLKFKFTNSKCSVKKLHKGSKGPRWSGGKKYDRPGAGERYALFCAECECTERNGMRHSRSPCYSVKSSW